MTNTNERAETPEITTSDITTAVTREGRTLSVSGPMSLSDGLSVIFNTDGNSVPGDEFADSFLELTLYTLIAGDTVAPAEVAEPTTSTFFITVETDDALSFALDGEPIDTDLVLKAWGAGVIDAISRLHALVSEG
jgi:hypothetical protein